MEAILRQCFDIRSPSSDSLVIEKLFSNIEIKFSDAAFPVRYSDADVKFEIGRGVPLAWFWCDAIVEIVENYCGTKILKDSREKVVALFRKDVLTFMRDEENINHLKKVKCAKSEAEIQAIVSHHLFILLAPSSEYLIHGNHSWPSEMKKCPACNVDLKLGNTSFGNHRVWNGSPDIIIDKTTVKVQIDQDEFKENEESRDYNNTEPIIKRLKVTNDNEYKNIFVAGREGSELVSEVCTTCIEAQKDQGFACEKILQQIFAQTITNAFYQTKMNPNLKDLCIPSFLVSNFKLKVLMYNCNQDRLYMSVDMPLWNENGNLNIQTIVCIWLALNFENFQNHVKEENLEGVGLKRSMFQAMLSDDILSIYKNELTMSLPLNEKKMEEPLPLTAFELPCSEYAQTVVEKMKKMANCYFT